VRANAGVELASAQHVTKDEHAAAELALLDHGARVRLDRQLDGRTPVVLTLCAAACGEQLRGLALDLEYLARDPQLRFSALTVRIDSHELAQDTTFVLDPHGRVVRRLADTSVETRDLWLALREASALTVTPRGRR
jgi:hypothetical protein